MACVDCFDNCEDTLTSDKCVKYTGPTIDSLGVCTGDPLSAVESIVLTKLSNLIQGIGINISELTGCNSVLGQFDSDSSLISIVQALISSYCSLSSTLSTYISSSQGSFPFAISCLSGLTSTSSRDQILQAVITLLCTVNTNVSTIEGDYVKATELNDLIASYISSVNNVTNVTNNYTLSIPYVAYEYYGPLTNFDSSGKGLADKGFDKMYLCNGQNGTPDKRGRTAVGAIAGVPGGALDSAVDPSLAQNAGNNYALKDKFGASSIALSVTQLPAHSHSITDPGHQHSLNPNAGVSQVAANGGYTALRGEHFNVNTNTTKNPTGITGTNSSGSSQPHSNVQPSIAAYYIMYLP